MIVRHYFSVAWDYPRSVGEPDGRAFVREWYFRGGNRRDYSELVRTWRFNNTQYYEPLNAVVLHSVHSKQSFAPGDYEPWAGAPSNKWRLVVPAGTPQAAYLKYYDTRPTQWGGVKLRRTYDLDAGVAVYVIRSAPTNLEVRAGKLTELRPADGLLKPWVSIALPDYRYRGETYRYCVLFPTYAAWMGQPPEEMKSLVGFGSWDLDNRKPLLRRAKIGPDGETVVSEWETLDEFSGNALQWELKRAAVNGGDLEEMILIRQLEGVLSIAAGSFGDWWNYSDAITRANTPVGTMRLYAQGHQVAFMVCQQFIRPVVEEFQDENGDVQTRKRFWGRVETQKPPELPFTTTDEAGRVVTAEVKAANLRVNVQAASGKSRGGSVVTPLVETDDPPTKLARFGATLETGNPLRTPILYRLQEVYPPDFRTQAKAPQVIGVTEVTVARQENELGMVRGATARVTVPGCCATLLPFFRGNEEMQIRAGALDCDGTDTGEYILFTGRVISPEVTLEGTTQPVPRVIELQDDSFRLEKKKCRSRIGDVAGWPWKDAWRHSLNAFGVPDTRIRINGWAWGTPELAQFETYVLPLPDARVDALTSSPDEPVVQGDLSPGYTVEAVKWLDYLCRQRGDWIWRIEPDGTYHALPRPDYRANPQVFVLEQDPADDDDRLWRVRHKRDLSEFVNEVEILGATSIREGSLTVPGTEIAPESALWQDKGSQENPAWRYYVGDVWEEVIDDPNLSDPAVAALKKGIRAEITSETIVWETQGKPLYPGMFVRSQLTGVDLPPGSIFRLTEEQRTLKADENEVTHQAVYTGVLEWMP